MGLSIFTTHFLFFDDQLYNAVWLRLPIVEYKFRKSLRKIKNKVENNFKVTIGVATFNEAKEKLFEEYKLQFKGNLHSSLRTYMLDDEYHNVYNTYECCVYDGNQLIAFSFFDIGSKATASILAAYNHNYSNFSLGMYTMLAEIEYSQKINAEYYYPGYFVPGFDRFDYKCRIGNTEYYNYFSKSWDETALFDDSRNLAEQLKLKIQEMFLTLYRENINVFVINYKNYELGDFYPEIGQIYNHPLFLLFEINGNYYAFEYDIRRFHYRLSIVKTPEMFRYRKNDVLFDAFGVINVYNLLECDDVVATEKDLKSIFAIIKTIS